MVPDAVKGSPASEARQQSQAVGGTKQRDADRGEWRGGGRGGEGEKGGGREGRRGGLQDVVEAGSEPVDGVEPERIEDHDMAA